MGEQEVAHVIDTKLHFDAFLGQRFRAVHHAGIVDQDMELILLALETREWKIKLEYFIGLLPSHAYSPSSEFANGIKGTQVQFAGEYILIVGLLDDLIAGLVTTVHIPASHVDGSSALCYFQDRLLADSCVGSRHDEHFSGFIGLLGKHSALHVFSDIK